MGNQESRCVFLASEASLVGEAYTVIRTGGKQEQGWSIPSERHSCDATSLLTWQPGPHASLNEDGWRVFMTDSIADPYNHTCGWRRIGTFWPSHLDNDQTAISTWVADLKATLERLASQQGLPTGWEEHTCSLGSPRDMCPGCCGEHEAKKKVIIK